MIEAAKTSALARHRQADACMPGTGHGLSTQRGAKDEQKLKGLTRYTSKAAGFSDPTPPERQGVIGRSDCPPEAAIKKSK